MQPDRSCRMELSPEGAGSEPAGSGGRRPAQLLPFVAALVALAPLSIDAYLPALPEIARHFNVELSRVSASVGTYLVGFAIGQLFGGPFSDQAGRKPITLVGLLVFLGATLGVLTAKSAAQLMTWRFVQAIGGGFAAVTAMAFVRDAYPPLETGKRLALVAMIMMIAPLIAPVLGSLLLRFGWQAIFWLFFAYAGILLLVLRGVPETLSVAGQPISVKDIVGQYRDTLATRMPEGHRAARIALALAFSGGLMMTFITQSAFIYLEHFELGRDAFLWLFAGNVATLIAANLSSLFLLGRVAPHTLFRAGLAVQLGATVWLGHAALVDAEVASVAPLIMLSVGSIGWSRPAGTMLYMSCFPRTGGSASALLTALTFGLGGLFGILPGLLPEPGLAPIVGVMLSAAVLANLVGFSSTRLHPGNP